MDARIVLLGPPGSGKGTQAERMEDELGFVRLSTGDLLREAVRNETELGKRAKEYMDQGLLVPNELVIGLMKERIDKLEGCYILDGFPRTMEQAEVLESITGLDAAINLDVDDEELVDRLTKRRSCPDCNAVFHLIYKPPAEEGVCDRCGGELYQRSDDSEETVRNRLKVYRESTFPLIKFYEERGVLHNIDGKGDIGEIFEAIKALI